MNIPKGKMTNMDISRFFEKSIEYHLEVFKKELSQYEPYQLYKNFNLLVRSMDEFINIPIELDDELELNTFLNLHFNIFNANNKGNFIRTISILGNRFDGGVAERFSKLAMMCYSLDSSYESNGMFEKLGDSFRLYNTKNAIVFFQSRRAYYVVMLNLIPKLSKGEKVIKYLDTLNFLQPIIDSCLINITTAYYNLILNHCILDYEIYSNGVVVKGNFEYNYLEGFFLSPKDFQC